MATERLGQTWWSEDAGDMMGQLPEQNKKWGSLQQSWGWRGFWERIPASRASHLLIYRAGANPGNKEKAHVCFSCAGLSSCEGGYHVMS